MIKFASLRALNMVESAGIGATATFMPLFANSLTNSYMLVGAIVAGYGLAQALSYTYFGRVYDRKLAAKSRLLLIRLGYLLCSAAFFIHILAFDGLSLFGIRLLAGVATGIYAGALIAKSYESTDGRKLAMAGIISFGALGWFAGTVGAGALKQAFGGDVDVVFAFSGLMFLAGFAVSLRMDSQGRKQNHRQENSGGSAAGAVASLEGQSVADDGNGRYDNGNNDGNDNGSSGNNGSGSKPVAAHTLSTTFQLLRANRVVYSSFFLRQLGASAVWSMFPIFLARELGASDLWIGVIYATNAMTQFVFMNRFGHAIQSNYYRSIELGAALSAAVFMGYFLAQSYVHVFPIQVVLGVSWSLLYVGSLLYLLDRNKEKATSTALLESTISVAAIVGPLAAGAVAELLGIRAVLVFAFCVTLGSFAMSKRLARQTVTAAAAAASAGGTKLQ